MTYAEKLKDPRWQKRRLEVLKFDNFTCQFCGDKSTTLHVHHFRYKKGLEPWEYEDHDLTTICSDCHYYQHNKQLFSDHIIAEINFLMRYIELPILHNWTKYRKKDLIRLLDIQQNDIRGRVKKLIREKNG